MLLTMEAAELFDIADTKVEDDDGIVALADDVCVEGGTNDKFTESTKDVLCDSDDDDLCESKSVGFGNDSDVDSDKEPKVWPFDKA